MRTITTILAALVLTVGTLAQKPASSPEEIAERFPPLREVEIPEVTSYTLSNGMELHLLEDHRLPYISGSASIRTGNLFDPPEKIGLAGITGSVWRLGGTESMTGEEIDEKLEGMAASVETSIGETSGRIDFWTLRENVDSVLAVFADILTGPAFRQDKIDFALQQARSAISRRNDDAAGIADREFRNLVYGPDTPYGWQVEYEHLERIEKSDLEAFYKRYVFPANMRLAVYGDFSADAMKEKIESALDDWTVKQPPVPPFPEVKRNPSGGVFLVEKQDVNQSNIRMGHLGGLLKDEDYPALRVMSTILGGGFQSRLFQQVRSNLGLAYRAGARWGADYGHPGIFGVTIGTKSESTVRAMEAALAEVDRIRLEPVTDQELQTAKDSVLNSFVFNFDTRRKTLDRLMVYLYWGYPRDFIFQFKDKVAAVTKEDVLRVARDYLRPDDLKIVVVGKPDEFDESLASLGREVAKLDITISEPEQELAAADEDSLAKGKAILAKAREAAGGAEKLASVKDATKKGTMVAMGGKMTMEQTTKVILPDLLWQENVLPIGALVVFVHGETGWMKSPQGQAPLPQTQHRDAQAALFRMRERLLLSDRDPERTVNFVEETEIDGKPADVIEISAQDGKSVRLWVDRESGEILKQGYRAALQGAPGPVEEVYSDYREVEGIRVPFKTVVFRDGEEFAELALEEVIYNSGLDAGELAQP